MNNHWKPVIPTLIYRLREPAGHPSFWAFYVGGVILFSGAGVWHELFHTETYASVGGPTGRVISSILTYFLAITGVTILQGILSEQKSYMRGFFTLVGIILLVPSLYLVFGHPVLNAVTIILVGVMTLVALILAWIVNGAHPNLKDDPPDSAIGGNVDSPLPGDGQF